MLIDYSAHLFTTQLQKFYIVGIEIYFIFRMTIKMITEMSARNYFDIWYYMNMYVLLSDLVDIILSPLSLFLVAMVTFGI